MAKIKFVTSRFDAQWGFQLNDGRIIAILDKDGQFLIKFNTPFNLETGEIGEQPPYKPFGTNSLPDGFTDINTLIREKKGKRVFCYDKFEVDLGWTKTMSVRRIKKIRETFSQHGFNVSEQAILHNYSAWIAGLKSGYRDEENGYHLFTPCGGNPLSFSATTLNQMCDDWQTTYTY